LRGSAAFFSTSVGLGAVLVKTGLACQRNAPLLAEATDRDDQQVLLIGKLPQTPNADSFRSTGRCETERVLLGTLPNRSIGALDVPCTFGRLPMKATHRGSTQFHSPDCSGSASLAAATVAGCSQQMPKGAVAAWEGPGPETD